LPIRSPHFIDARAEAVSPRPARSWTVVFSLSNLFPTILGFPPLRLKWRDAGSSTPLRFAQNNSMEGALSVWLSLR
jgi:hypothetical protein